MNGYPEEKNSVDVDEILKVRVTEDLMERIKIFCADNDMTIQQFARDALVEKLDQWRE